MDVIHYSEDIATSCWNGWRQESICLQTTMWTAILIESRISMQTMIMTAFMNDGMFQKVMTAS